MDGGRVAEETFQQESGRILAALIRISGSFDLAEEALQDAFAAALPAWSQGGIPANPGAWIMAVARRKILDQFRRNRTRKDNDAALRYESKSLTEPADFSIEDENTHFPDDRLRLIFTCCHPALNKESQVALTLRTLGGLTTGEIAKAFLLPEATLAQRLVRAKRKIQDTRIPYVIPGPEHLRERLSGVQAVIYLVFNEGYLATAGEDLVRSSLCDEAIRLGRVLASLLPRDAETRGLLALMLLHDSRREARMHNGALVTLEEQDRSLWDRSKIAEGITLIGSALEAGDLGPYQLQAAISAIHAESPEASATDWAQIARLYERLLLFQNTPVVRLNHAVAVALSGDLQAGLDRIDVLGSSGDLDRYYLFHAARGDLLRRMNRMPEACRAYRAALRLATNRLEQRFLERRIEMTEGL
ncbi:MAG TPA: RNA polymerase sigma factor [Bryobacteraceae bacterium]|jgi:RNA polymerase sigma-70 factor (ECF subfamily)